ncbi:hypothetical protein AMECASPLE_038192 [Ameca splendens]|uniref:Uncharacterized protein n=1 Tax=Ameca splendens TaxID=208324 RepID=A0ABV1AEK4_9TELE
MGLSQHQTSLSRISFRSTSCFGWIISFTSRQKAVRRPVSSGSHSSVTDAGEHCDLTLPWQSLVTRCSWQSPDQGKQTTNTSLCCVDPCGLGNTSSLG